MLEPTEVARWERLTAAMLRHAAQDDPEALSQVVKVLDGAYSKLPTVVAELRAPAQHNGGMAPGYSWSQIAAALGVSRQAAAQRFSR